MGKYKTTVNYPTEGSGPRMEILRDNVSTGAKFPMKDVDDKEARKKAEDYASEMQRETRGKKAGGVVKSASARADGCAQRGKTRGRIM